MTEELEGISPVLFGVDCRRRTRQKVRNGSFPRKETVLVNLTGGDRPVRRPHRACWLRREGTGWVEEA
jgi:hypothetical protein